MGFRLEEGSELMGGMFKKAKSFARSPQGKRAERKATDYAKSPQGKRQIASVRERIMGGRGKKRGK